MREGNRRSRRSFQHVTPARRQIVVVPTFYVRRNFPYWPGVHERVQRRPRRLPGRKTRRTGECHAMLFRRSLYRSTVCQHDLSHFLAHVPVGLRYCLQRFCCPCGLPFAVCPGSRTWCFGALDSGEASRSHEHFVASRARWQAPNIRQVVNLGGNPGRQMAGHAIRSEMA